MLTHWGRVTHICVGNLIIIGSDNGLSRNRRQAITSTNVGILLIGPLGTNFSEMLIEIHTFSFKKIHLKMSSGKWRPFCLGLNVLSYNRIPNDNARKFSRYHRGWEIFWNTLYPQLHQIYYVSNVMDGREKKSDSLFKIRSTIFNR